MKDSRLLNILLYVSKAAEGYMAEKHGTEESYLVFSNWLPSPFLFFQHSWTEPPWLKYRKHELNTPCFSMGTQLQIFQGLGGVYNCQSRMTSKS